MLMDEYLLILFYSRMKYPADNVCGGKLTGNVSDQKIVDDVTPAGYSCHHAARIHKKGEGNGILIGDSLKCEAHLRFQAKSFESY